MVNGCVADGGLDRFGEGFRLSVHVRLMHAFVGYHHEHETDWDSGVAAFPSTVRPGREAGTVSITFMLHTPLLGVRYTRARPSRLLHCGATSVG